MEQQPALDIGSGVGWVVQYLWSRNIPASGCDISESAVSALKMDFPQARFFRFNAGVDHLPDAFGTLALVTMLDVAYHIVDDGNWRCAISEIASSLRSGGTFIVTDGFGDTTEDVADHVRLRSRAAWTEVAATVGLVCDRTLPYMHYLSRREGVSRMDLLPDNLRGAIEFGLDMVKPEPAHLRGATFVKL
jgi:SAM-dependent methyltransferase